MLTESPGICKLLGTKCLLKEKKEDPDVSPTQSSTTTIIKSTTAITAKSTNSMTTKHDSTTTTTTTISTTTISTIMDLPTTITSKSTSTTTKYDSTTYSPIPDKQSKISVTTIKEPSDYVTITSSITTVADINKIRITRLPSDEDIQPVYDSSPDLTQELINIISGSSAGGVLLVGGISIVVFVYKRMKRTAATGLIQR